MALQKIVYLSLGSNLGERETNLERALALLQRSEIDISKRSSIYETAPQELVHQPWFLNMAVQAETTLLPVNMLRVLQSVEHDLGRDRSKGVRFGPRAIDIDILLYGRAVIRSQQLTIPHPRMLERRFVLEPLLEIAPELRDPITGTPLRNYLPGVIKQQLRRPTVTRHASQSPSDHP